MSKFLGAILSLVLLSPMANAIAHGPGWVNTVYCGEAREQVVRMGGLTMTQVCTATIGGSGGKYIRVTESQVRPNRQQLTIWEINQVTPSRGNMEFLTVTQVGFVENGIFKKVLNVRASLGTIGVQKDVSGAPVKMAGDLDGRKFKATKFEEIFHAL